MKDPTPKQLFTLAIKDNIVKKDWPKLAEVLISAETYGVTKGLQRKGWYLVGQYEYERENLPAAIVSFNSARSIDPVNLNILDGFFSSYLAYFEKHESVFSREDLLILEGPIKRMVNYYQVHQSIPDKNIQIAKELLKRIRLRRRNAPSKEETPETHHVIRIFDGLYPKMAPAEIQAEFANLVVPLIRDYLEKKPKDKPSKKPPARKPKDTEDGSDSKKK
jgi:hypothetical protein